MSVSATLIEIGSPMRYGLLQAFAVSLLAVGAGPTSVADTPIQSASPDRNQEVANVGDSLVAASYAQALLANLDAIRRGDCLIRFEKFVDTGGDEGVGRFEEGVIHMRFIFDRDQDLYFFCRNVRGHFGIYGEGGALETSDSRFIDGFVIHQSDAAVRYTMKGVERPQATLDQVAQKIHVPCLFHVGFISVGTGYDERAIHDNITYYTSGAQDAVISPAPTVPADRRTVSFITNYVYEGSDRSLTIKWTWNDVKMVPESRLGTTKGRRADGSTFVRPEDNTTYSWESISGLMVPSSVYSRRSVAFRVEGRFTPQADLFERMDVHWFSVNEELPDDSFRHARMHDLRDLIRSTDPSETGAVFPR